MYEELKNKNNMTEDKIAILKCSNVTLAELATRFINDYDKINVTP